jgi:hypothetical protein
MQARAKLSICVMALAAAVSLMAGGFVLQIGKPDANPEAQTKHAVLVVRGFACADQEKTTVTGIAEGLVNGVRQSVALKLIPLSDQSTYAVTDQWPDEGRWVLTLAMTNPRFGQQSAIVRVNPGGVDWAGITRFNRAPSKEDVEAALKAPASTSSVAAR